MKVLSMLATATLVCGALQRVSHLTTKPTRDFHETVVGFSEQCVVALTVNIAHVPELADPSHDLLENLVNIKQIHRLGSGKRTIACNVLLRVLKFLAQSCRNYVAFSHLHVRTEWTAQVFDSDQAHCSQLVAENRSGPGAEPAHAVHQ
jgi:hypothetical protein